MNRQMALPTSGENTGQTHMDRIGICDTMANRGEFTENDNRKNKVLEFLWFLRECVVPVGKRKRSELLDLAIKAIKYDLEAEKSHDDDGDLAAENRKIHGIDITHISSLESSNWTSDLRTIPRCDFC